MENNKTLHVVSFSGGKDSTAMLLMMIEKGMQIDKIICIDTTKEFPEMYQHIEKVKKYISPLEITAIKIDFDYWFGEHIKTRGKNKGKVGYGWPDFKNRWCTALKTEASSFILNTEDYNGKKRGTKNSEYKKYNIIEYHGIAYDERKRINNNDDGRKIKYPLVDWNITENEALQYCYNHGFDWNGLYKIKTRVSCYLCPLQQIRDLRYIYNNRPELWEKMIDIDNKSFRKYRSDYSLKDLENKFDKENNKEEG